MKTIIDCKSIGKYNSDIQISCGCYLLLLSV